GPPRRRPHCRRTVRRRGVRIGAADGGRRGAPHEPARACECRSRSPSTGTDTTINPTRQRSRTTTLRTRITTHSRTPDIARPDPLLPLPAFASLPRLRLAFPPCTPDGSRRV